MSTTSSKFDMERSIIQSNLLPPTFMQAFSVDEEHAKCRKCNFICELTTCNTFFHLTVCNGSLVEENIQNNIKLNCLMCNFSTKNINVWKNHLFHFHIPILNPYLCATKYSYDCELCKIHFYGSEDEILKHRCKPKAISMLSKFMVCVYNHFNVHNKRMVYYCAGCQHYSYNLTDLHIKKLCTAIKNRDNFVCNSCLITFYGCCKDTFSNHKVSFQHLALWCLNGDRSKPKTLASMQWKLPSYMSNFFEMSTILLKVCCNVCNKVIALKYDCIYNHFIECICSKDISENDKNTPLRILICNLCDYQYSSSEDLYKDWVQHVISLDHLKKTIGNRYDLYTYYCFVSETVYYGTESFMVQQILKNNADIGRLLFVSKVMAQVYRRSNTYSSKIEGNILYCCGFCESSTDEQSEYCKHATIDLNQMFNCSSCLVVFNVKSDYIEHLVSSEHIILRYFKPNQLSEFKILEHSMNTLKMNASNLIESDDDMSTLLSDMSSLEELTFSLQSDSIEFDCTNLSSETHPSSDVVENDLSINSEQSHLTEQCRLNSENDSSSNQLYSNIECTENMETCNSEIDILNFIEKLSVKSKKSALNNHLRMNFEILNQMPLAMNVIVELKSFFCTVCDIIHCDLLQWTQHILQFHTQLDLSLFYCDICQIYQTGTSISNRKHLETLEHSVMSEFQEYMKKNKHSINNATCDNNSIAANDDSKQVKKKNIKHGVVSKSQKYTKNIKKRSLMNSNISHDVSTTDQLNNNIYILFKDKFKTFDLMIDWCMMCTQISDQLDEQNRLASQTKINKLCESICSLNVGLGSFDVQVFGSQGYGLATEKSDVDLYLEIDGTFDGDKSNKIERAINLVEKFAQQLDLKPEEFKNIIKICDVRVPIIKFYHIPTNVYCDIAFSGKLHLYNSKLIKSYLSMDPTVKWLAHVIVQNWAVKNNLIDKNKFSKYQLIWLVLFYLMKENVVRPLFELMRNSPSSDHIIVEGWDCMFGEMSGRVKNQNRPKLLLGFFQFYTNKINLTYNVLCTLTGKCMKKDTFFSKFSNSSVINETQRAMFKTFKSNISLNFQNFNGLTVQDPFNLSYNLTENINDANLTNFCNICNKTIMLLINTKCCNTF